MVIESSASSTVTAGGAGGAAGGATAARAAGDGNAIARRISARIRGSVMSSLLPGPCRRRSMRHRACVGIRREVEISDLRFEISSFRLRIRPRGVGPLYLLAGADAPELVHELACAAVLVV